MVDSLAIPMLREMKDNMQSLLASHSWTYLRKFNEHLFRVETRMDHMQ